MSQAQLSWYVFLAGAVLFVGSILVAGGIMACLGKECDSFQRPAPEGEMWFCRPFAERIPMALFSLAFFGGAVFITGVCFDPIAIGGGIWSDILPVSVCMTVAVWVLRRAGPDEIYLDLKARTFRRVTGWPLFPVVLTGTWKQIFGIYVRKVGGSSSNKPYYLVELYWTGDKGGSVVGSYNAKEDAEAEAERLQAVLGMRRVIAPKPI